jgi:hypothetical protein
MDGYGQRFDDLAKEAQRNPQNLAALDDTLKDLRTDIAIVALKLIPMVDPDTRQIMPLDVVARKLAERTKLGGSFRDDPIAAGYYTMVRKDYFYNEAQIVPLPDGSYVSIHQFVSAPLPTVLNSNERGRTIETLIERCRDLKNACEQENSAAFITSTTGIAEMLSTLASPTQTKTMGGDNTGKTMKGDQSREELARILCDLAKQSESP